MARRDPSPYETLETAFGLLTSGPEPLSLDGRLVGHGLPPRAIPLDELRGMLLHPSVAFAARDAAVAELARRARRDRGAAMVGLAGVLLPGLRRLACAGALAVVLVALLAAPALAQAADPTLSGVIDRIRNLLVGLLAGLATLFLTVGGVRYLLAGGDPGQVEKAKITLKSAAIGYALAALATPLVGLLKYVVGA